MSGIVEMLASWQTLGLLLLVWGFAPRQVLRLILLAYHPSDERRREILAESYTVARVERPFWVCEQIEVALVEGLGERVFYALEGRLFDRWSLMDGVKQNRLYPSSFWIPDAEERATLQPGDHVKLCFQLREGWGERMWVEVVKSGRRGYVGELINQPMGIAKLNAGDRLRFRPNQVIDLLTPDDPEYHPMNDGLSDSGAPVVADSGTSVEN